MSDIYHFKGDKQYVKAFQFKDVGIYPEWFDQWEKVTDEGRILFQFQGREYEAELGQWIILIPEPETNNFSLVVASDEEFQKEMTTEKPEEEKKEKLEDKITTAVELQKKQEAEKKEEPKEEPKPDLKIAEGTTPPKKKSTPKKKTPKKKPSTKKTTKKKSLPKKEIVKIRKKRPVPEKRVRETPLVKKKEEKTRSSVMQRCLIMFLFLECQWKIRDIAHKFGMVDSEVTSILDSITGSKRSRQNIYNTPVAMIDRRERPYIENKNLNKDGLGREDAFIKECYENGRSWLFIGQCIGRSPQTIKSRFERKFRVKKEASVFPYWSTRKKSK